MLEIRVFSLFIAMEKSKSHLIIVKIIVCYLKLFPRKIHQCYITVNPLILHGNSSFRPTRWIKEY